MPAWSEDKSPGRFDGLAVMGGCAVSQVREDEAKKTAGAKGTPQEEAGAAAHVGGPIKHAGN